MLNPELEQELYHQRYSKDYIYHADWSHDEERYFYEVVIRNLRQLRYFNNETLWGYKQPTDVKEMKFLYSRSADKSNKPNRLKGYYSNSLLEFNQNILERNHEFYRELNQDWYHAYDFYFTPNTFQAGTVKPLMNDLLNVYCVALDVDYKDHGSGNAKANPDNFFWDCISPLCGSVIPTPNYVEYSHQLRLIYVLEEPVYAKNRKMLKTVKIMLQRMSDALNSELDCGCEPQKVSSYFRMPGSKNTKDGSVVHVQHITNVRWTVQELMSEFLPELPDWYEDWTSKKKKKGASKLRNYFTLWAHRLEAIKAAQCEEGVNRENTVFLYVQYLMWTQPNLSDSEIMELALEFNQDFDNPLKEREIRSKLGATIKARRRYKFSNNTLNEFVGIDLEIECGRTRDELRDQRIANGDMRWQKTDAKAAEVQKLKAEGKTNQEIAELLGLKVRMVQYLNKRTPKKD